MRVVSRKKLREFWERQRRILLILNKKIYFLSQEMYYSLMKVFDSSCGAMKNARMGD